jgi:hypothetical protein
MNPFKLNPTDNPAIVIDIKEEQKIEREALGLIELYDFLKTHPDSVAKDVAKFMPPVDSRAVNKAIQMIALREEKNKNKNI